MNPHYHAYGGGAPELSSPPSPDNNNYHSHHPVTGGGGGGPHGGPGGMPPTNGHMGGGGGMPGDPHGGHHQHHPAFGPGGPQHHPHHHHHHGHPLNNNSVKICAGCGGKIVERFLLHALDRYWHNSCLKCSCCGAMLADIGSSCFTKSSMILCKADYMRLFGSSGACSACGQMIPASEFVMRTPPPLPPPPGGAVHGGHHVFHLKCFACSKCGAQLVSGDRYYMLAGSLVCEQDWHKLLKGSTAAQGTTVRKGKVGRPRRSRD